MLADVPLWRFTAREPVTRWNEHVRLLPDRVVGQWFCLDRETGECLWERQHVRPDEIVGIDRNVIVANERLRQSISSARVGCYGISLDTGKLIWTSHAAGIAGPILRLLDFLPDYPNLLFRDCPVLVIDGQCYCRSGRVLDVQTGTQIDRIARDTIPQPTVTETDTVTLGRTVSPDLPLRLKLPGDLRLSHKPDVDTTPDPTGRRLIDAVWNFRLYATRDDGSLAWQFDLNDTGLESVYGPYEDKCRYAYPYLHILACEKRTTRRDGCDEVYNRSLFHLLTLDLITGQVVQNVRISDQSLKRCRFESVDRSGALVSLDDVTLHYYPTASTTPEAA